jgi:hypothetical protein
MLEMAPNHSQSLAIANTSSHSETKFLEIIAEKSLKNLPIKRKALTGCFTAT